MDTSAPQPNDDEEVTPTSIGAGESDLNGADSETWLYENWSVFHGIVKRAEEQFANGETISPDEFWRKLEGSTAA
jgi:hypothetical protein